MTAVLVLAEQHTSPSWVTRGKWLSLGSAPGHSIPFTYCYKLFLPSFCLVAFDLPLGSPMSNLWSDWPTLIGHQRPAALFYSAQSFSVPLLQVKLITCWYETKYHQTAFSLTLSLISHLTAWVRFPNVAGFAFSFVVCVIDCYWLRHFTTNKLIWWCFHLDSSLSGFLSSDAHISLISIY